MLKFRDYLVRVWEDGDISLSTSNELQYATLGSMDGIQCNADHWTPMYQRLYGAAKDAAEKMVELDKLVEENLEVNPHKEELAEY